MGTAAGAPSFCAKLFPDLWKTLTGTLGAVSPVAVNITRRKMGTFPGISAEPASGAPKRVAVFLWKLSALHCCWGGTMTYSQQEILRWRQVPLFNRYPHVLGLARRLLIVLLHLGVHHLKSHFMVIACTMAISLSKWILLIQESVTWKAYKYTLAKASDLSSLTILTQKTYAYQHSTTML